MACSRAMTGRERRSAGAWRVCALLGMILLVAPGCTRSDASWVADLSHPDPFARALAAFALSKQAPERAPTVVPVLLETVDRSELALGDAATLALVEIAPHAIDELLHNLVADEFMTTDRRQAIMTALLNVGPAVVRPVIACVAGVGRALAPDLGQLLVQTGPPAAAPLAEILRTSDDQELRGFALLQLVRLGAGARSVLPVLEELRSTANVQFAAALTEAIGRIRASSAAGRGPR